MLCKHCGKDFTPKQVFCSTNCRIYNHRAIKEGYPIPADEVKSKDMDELRQLLIPKSKVEAAIPIVEEKDDVEIISDKTFNEKDNLYV